MRTAWSRSLLVRSREPPPGGQSGTVNPSRMWGWLTARAGRSHGPTLNRTVARLEAERAGVRDVLIALGGEPEKLERRAKQEEAPGTLAERVNAQAHHFFPVDTV